MKDLEQLRRDTILAKNLKQLDEKHDALLQSVATMRGYMEAVKKDVSRVLNLPKGDKGERGPIGPQGIPGKNGKDGQNGKDGYTPIKGKDYFTEGDKEEVAKLTLKRIKTPKDGKDAIVDEEKIANSVIGLIKEKQLLDTDSISGLRGELSSYRHQMAMKQAGQHGGGDTVVAGSGITITSNANGTKTIASTASGGTVTDVSVVSANGFAGTVATSTTTPAITLTTTVTGILKGNGTAMSAAVANTDYQVPISLTTTGSSGAATFDGTTLNIPQYAAGGNVSNTGTPANNQIAVWTDATTIEGTAGLTYDGSNFLLTGDIGATGTRITKGWFTDLEVTNAIAGSITGTAAVATTVTVADEAADATCFINFTTAATGNLGIKTNTHITFDSTTNVMHVHGIAGDATDGLLVEAANGTDIGILGAGNTANVTWYGSHNFNTATQDTIAAFTGAGKTLGSLATATYPSLTELSYVKGVTSAIQTQLNAKQATITFGTGVETALGVNVGTAGSIVVNGGALGTPSSGTLTNATGLPIATGVSGLGTGVATFLATPSSANLASAVTDETGSGSLVFGTSPTITTATFSGSQTLSENASIALDPSLSADGKYTGVTMTGTAGATLAFGDVIYLAAADSRWELADASSITTGAEVLIGMCVLAAAADGDPTTILLVGNVRADAVFPALTISAPIYLSETAGDITHTEPTTTDSVTIVLGKALTADSIFFISPMDWLTHT